MTFITALVTSLLAFAAAPQAEELAPYARIQTSLGTIDIELYREDAPVTVENFLTYAADGFYDRLVFHRVVSGTLIQGGGYNDRLYPRATRPPIVNEAANGRKNLRGTIAMARLDDPDSATSQFFINLSDNPFLDRTGDEYKKDAGYTVFGKVVAGMDVADAIGAVATSDAEGYDYFPAEVPVEPVIILRVDPLENLGLGEAQE
ncbi:MAG: peptidylprolyl isomerase [Parvularcula sp.]